jgi:hypothetical protein
LGFKEKSRQNTGETPFTHAHPGFSRIGKLSSATVSHKLLLDEQVFPRWLRRLDFLKPIFAAVTSRKLNYVFDIHNSFEWKTCLEL